MERRIERATAGDREPIAALLAACGLSAWGILAPETLYWVCRAERGLAGTCGIELGARCALLRSVCVSESERGKRIGERLVASALLEAARLGLWDVYLFSKDTGGYFERLGWREVPVAEVAARLPQAPQVLRYAEVGWYPDERAFLRRSRP